MAECGLGDGGLQHTRLRIHRRGPCSLKYHQPLSPALAEALPRDRQPGRLGGREGTRGWPQPGVVLEHSLAPPLPWAATLDPRSAGAGAEVMGMRGRGVQLCSQTRVAPGHSCPQGAAYPTPIPMNATDLAGLIPS